jgi:arginine:ornithine antiporter/lysine permease
MGKRKNSDQKVGVFGLTALIVGSAIGSGIFALPATLTAGANAEGILIGWVIVGLGMLSLVIVYRNLTLRQPKIDDGIYGWSKNMFGHFGGFIGAYGHGAGDAIGNASYLVVIFSALGAFGIFNFFGEGTTWPAVFVASALLWLVNYFVLQGVRTSTKLNNVITVVKVIPIALFILLAILHFNYQTFIHGFNSTQVFNPITNEVAYVSIFDQSKSVLLAAMWTLIGIESGTIYATRAKKLSDVAKATTVGALIVIVLLVGTTILALGILTPAEISVLHHPSMAGLMDKMVGPWGGELINLCLIVSVLGALIAWVSLSAEEVRLSGRGGSGTKWLNGLNKKEAPVNSMWLTTGITQVLMLIAGFSHAGYVVLLSFSTSLALIPYLFSSLYALKSGITGKGYESQQKGRLGESIFAFFAVVFVLYMIYGAGLRYLLLAAIVWAVGLPLFILGSKEQRRKLPVSERITCIFVLILALVGVISLFTGWITF